MDSCRKQCQTIRSPNTYFSFFLSMKKLCYCLPIKLSPNITTIGVRKPLIHCSFLPYIRQKLNNSFNSSDINSDTVVKINVQRYCSSSFIFDRSLFLCLRIVLLNVSNSYAKIIGNEVCSSVLIKTIEQWIHLLSLLPLLGRRIFIGIDRNSTYIMKDLLQQRINSLPTGNLCLMINRTRSTSYDLIPCSNIQSPGYIVCSQKPFEPINYYQSEFQSTYVFHYLLHLIFLPLRNSLPSSIISLVQSILCYSIICVIMLIHPLFIAFNMVDKFVLIDIQIVLLFNFIFNNGAMSIVLDFLVEHSMISY